MKSDSALTTKTYIQTHTPEHLIGVKKSMGFLKARKKNGHSEKVYDVPRPFLWLQRVAIIILLCIIILGVLFHFETCLGCAARFFGSVISPADFEQEYAELRRVGKIPEHVRIGLLVPTSTKFDIIDESLSLYKQLDLFTTLLPSLLDTMRCKNDVSYIMYLGIGNDDKYLHDKHENLVVEIMETVQAKLNGRCNFSVQVVYHDIYDSSTCSMNNVLSRRMWRERRADYGVVLADDLLVRGKWVEAFISALVKNPYRENFGVVGSEETHHRFNWQHTPRYPFFHRMHLSIFDGDFCDEAVVRSEGASEILCGVYKSLNSCMRLNDASIEWTDHVYYGPHSNDHVVRHGAFRGERALRYREGLRRAVSRGVVRGRTRVKRFISDKPLREPFIME